MAENICARKVLQVSILWRVNIRVAEKKSSPAKQNATVGASLIGDGLRLDFNL